MFRTSRGASSTCIKDCAQGSLLSPGLACQQPQTTTHYHPHITPCTPDAYERTAPLLTSLKYPFLNLRPRRRPSARAPPVLTSTPYISDILHSDMSFYTSSPTSPLSGFFPTAPAGPHAFAGFQQDPRAQHATYAALGSGTAHNAAQGHAIARARAAAHQPQRTFSK